MPTAAETKKALVQAGLEVYQTRGEVVHVAERVRENLIMDSRIRVHAGHPSVIVGVRAQRNDFPDDADDALFDRARRLAAPILERGYTEKETLVTAQPDPSDAGRTLDTWCEVFFEKPVEDLDRAMDEVKFALAFEKTATRR